MKAQAKLETDTIDTPNGNVVITFVGHGTLMMEYNGKTIHIDPVSREADYSTMPKGDLVLITHHHGDHLDFNAISKIKVENTIVIGTETCKKNLENVEMTTMQNGDKKEAVGLSIKAVPAYNVEHKRSNGNPYHMKGEGNGYVISFDGFNVYVAGDTENTKEMKALENIDIAFLPMNLPYTMTPEMVVDAAKAFKPKILYPYHYGSTDTNILLDLMKDEMEVEVRIRKL